MKKRSLLSIRWITHFIKSRMKTCHSHPLQLVSRKLSTAIASLPKASVCLEYDGKGEMALRLLWQQTEATGIEPFSMTVSADSKLVSMNKREDGSACFSLINNVDTAKTNTAKVDKNANDARQQRLIERVQRFVAEHLLLRFNKITVQTECAYIDNVDAGGHHLYVGVDQRLLNAITVDAIGHGINCWDKDIKRCIESTKVAEYHPFMQYMDRLPEWDGKDRVEEVAHLISHDVLWTKTFHRWLLGMVAQWMQHGDRRYANSVAPLLISTRQGWGKSTFCRALMPQCLLRYYTDSYDITSEARAEQKLTAFGLINIDEFDKLSAKKQPLLKNLMQMPTANIRRPYKHVFEQLPRIASFIATSNRRDILTDKSGSRRFICIELERPINGHYAVEHDQLYAQLKHELLSDERYWLSKQEEADIQRHNKQYYVATPIADLFNEMFKEVRTNDVSDFATTTSDGGTTTAKTPILSAADIYERMKKAHPQAMRGTSLTTFSRLLPTLATTVHTQYGNGYKVIEVSDL